MLVIQRPTVEALGEAEGDRQRFAIGPLEPGFGHTLGNSLRRTLLSAIPGAAVTQIRFDDALHEFTTLPGVEEDVTLRIDARGPATVTARDIQPAADVEVLNPDLHIATLNSRGRLALDLF